MLEGNYAGKPSSETPLKVPFTINLNQHTWYGLPQNRARFYSSKYEYIRQVNN